jgi:hypothetical protein
VFLGLLPGETWADFGGSRTAEPLF